MHPQELLAAHPRLPHGRHPPVRRRPPSQQQVHRSGGEILRAVSPDTVLEEGDLLLFAGERGGGCSV